MKLENLPRANEIANRFKDIDSLKYELLVTAHKILQITTNSGRVIYEGRIKEEGTTYERIANIYFDELIQKLEEERLCLMEEVTAL